MVILITIARPCHRPAFRVHIHVKPQDRTTWSLHGKDGWYTGPALESYRCCTVWIWQSRSSRICDTITWLPTKLAMPIASSIDRILSGIDTTVQVLHHPLSASPSAPLSTTHHDELLQLTDILTSGNPNHTTARSASQTHPRAFPAPSASPNVRTQRPRYISEGSQSHRTSTQRGISEGADAHRAPPYRPLCATTVPQPRCYFQ